MKNFKFNELPYQRDATQAVVDIFKGQKIGARRDIVSRDAMLTESIFSNKPLDLTDLDLLKNVQEIQEAYSLDISERLENNNYTIEMETGTGKTYVYTQTMFELNKQYGWSKFIIMVPSIAIREGVKQSLDDTQEHFYHKYGKKIRFFIYDTKNQSNLINIKNFANTNNIEVIIMNYQAFGTRSKEARKIFQKLDSLQSEKPIDIIKRANPILIIDEPQKFGPTAEGKLKEFNPLFRLRYSATHKKDYNKVYRLDAIDAVDKKLVKKIKVKGFDLTGDTGTNSYLYLDRIKVSQNSYPVAYIELEIKQKNGLSKKVRRIKETDNLYTISNSLTQYKGFIVKEINGLTNRVKFTNGIEIGVGQAFGDIDEKHLRRIQIRETIDSHLKKEKEMFNKGIKVLSLFFIDEVARYRKYDKEGNELKGEYAEIFEEEYNRAISQKDLFDQEYQKYLNRNSTEKIHNGYFSIDKGRMVNTSGETQGDTTTYELIMKDKKKLLSFEEPTRFVFSHSALSEGWDNPNVFQICTLKHSKADDRKRQEIGRGLRICVDEELNRLDYTKLEEDFFDINSLTVVASESYDSFAKKLQGEIFDSLSDRPIALDPVYLEDRLLTNDDQEEVKITKKIAMDLVIDFNKKGYIDENYFLTEKLFEDVEEGEFRTIEALEGFEKGVINIMKRIYETANFQATENGKAENVSIAELNPNENFSKEEFQKLWSKIKVKTSYMVDFDTNELINNVIREVDRNLEIKASIVKVTQGEQREEADYEDYRRRIAFENEGVTVEMVDAILGNIKYDLINELVKGGGITRRTAAAILEGISEEKFALFHINPEDFIQKINRIINEQKAVTLINKITYSKTEDEYSDEIFTINNFSGSLQRNILEVKKHIYDYVKTEAKEEREFAKNLENGEILVYAKLPSSFQIPTPVGGYNPDWAIVFDKDDVKYIYFIAETKGSMSTLDLRGKEKLKIDYAKKHFEALGNDSLKYDVVDSYEELLNKVLK